jgi:hypothetical protein
MWRIEGQVIEFVLLVDKRDRLICMALRDIVRIAWYCMALYGIALYSIAQHMPIQC